MFKWGFSVFEVLRTTGNQSVYYYFMPQMMMAVFNTDKIESLVEGAEVDFMVVPLQMLMF